MVLKGVFSLLSLALLDVSITTAYRLPDGKTSLSSRSNPTGATLGLVALELGGTGSRARRACFLCVDIFDGILL